MDFEETFISAFLSKDYKEELAQKVRIRKERERVNLWKPNITEAEIVKFILRNTKPQFASHLHGGADSIGKLLKLGNELKKDQQLLRYEPSGTLTKSIQHQKITSKAVEKPLVTY